MAEAAIAKECSPSLHMRHIPTATSDQALDGVD